MDHKSSVTDYLFLRKSGIFILSALFTGLLTCAGSTGVAAGVVCAAVTGAVYAGFDAVSEAVLFRNDGLLLTVCAPRL